MTRLVIFTTHPIQYQVPWFQALALEADIDLEVVFSYIPTAREQGIGFGRAFNWDIPLLDGYRWRVLKTRGMPDWLPAFARRWASDIGSALDEIRPDVAVVLGWQEVSLVQALAACRHRSIPVVLRGESNGMRPRGNVVSLIHRRYFKLCDGFLAIGKANAAFYAAAGVGQSRIVTASYFVDNARFALAADRLRHERVLIRQSFGLPEGSTCFAFVGKLEPKKRPLDVIQGLRLARQRGADVCGLFVGSGELMEDVRAAAKANDVPITLAGFLNQSEIVRAYVAADALVLPSNFGETWGLVVNEAMATGLPAIVSERVGAAYDLVIHGETGLVVPFGSTDAIADAMTQLSAQPSERANMGRRARNRVNRDYSVARAVEATRTLIGRIGAAAGGNRVEA